MSTKTVTLLALLAMLVTGCQLPAAAPSLPVATAVEPAGDSPAVDEPAEVVGGDIDLAADDSYGLTNHRLDGNRVVEGYTDLSQITPIDVKLDGVPVWIASVSTWRCNRAFGRSLARLAAG